MPLNHFNAMKSTRLMGVFLTALILPLTASAQNIFYMEHKGTMRPVRRVQSTRPFVDDNGKLVMASGKRCLLNPVSEYLPVLVSIRNRQARSVGTQLGANGRTHDSKFIFSAEFVSDWKCEDVFLVVEINVRGGGTLLFCHEIGQMDPGAPREMSCNVDSVDIEGPLSYSLHVFVNGRETLNSDQDFGYREGVLDAMIAKRIEKVQNAGPKFFSGPQPTYPRALKDTNSRGEAMASFRIADNGAVGDVEITTATHPAFGEAVKNALRQWRFLPKVEDGRPVETKATLPFEFAPELPAPAKP